tara:strand:- start:594 stop:746 length:153 start_codon:yes stop_codon:yes gene_type:complete
MYPTHPNNPVAAIPPSRRIDQLLDLLAEMDQDDPDRTDIERDIFIENVYS